MLVLVGAVVVLGPRADRGPEASGSAYPADAGSERPTGEPSSGADPTSAAVEGQGAGLPGEGAGGEGAGGATLVEAPPPFLLGSFEDDYGAGYTITADLWRHEGSRYRVVRWAPEEQYAIAQNAAENLSAPGFWTRIDWVRLEDMAPWEWAFCLSVWDAPTREAAASVETADRADPENGCGGFPFSRMKPAG